MIKKTKILYVHHAGGFGGAPKSMSYIIKNLDRNECEPILLNITEGPINDFFRQELNCSLIIDSRARPFHGSTVVGTSIRMFFRNWICLLPSIIIAYKHIKTIKPDLLHLNSTCLLSFAIASKLLNVKTICHVREPLRVGFWGMPLSFFNNKCVNGYIAISNFDLKSLGNIPNFIKRKVIYNFVDKFYVKNYTKENHLKKSLNLTNSDVVFLYLARFSKSNGWDELIEMAKNIESKNIYFVLLGASNESHYVSSNGNVHILPFSTNIDMYLEDADVFVCPFVEPHFARGIIEASAYSLPCLGNNIGGVNELILHNQTGYLYNNEKEFVKYCEELSTNIGLRNELGINAYNFAKENFNIEHNLKATYEFYSEFIQD